MASELNGKRVAILAADGVERVGAGAAPAGARPGGRAHRAALAARRVIQARNNDLEAAGTFDVDALVRSASVEDYDALLLPGGTVNPDKLRVDQAAVGFVRDFVGTGKPVASICHGPWTLLEAGVVSGRTLTSFPSIRTDLRNAGATVVDQEVATDGNLITSRSPDDLLAFCTAIVQAFARVGAAAGDAR
jgi:protease I